MEIGNLSLGISGGDPSRFKVETSQEVLSLLDSIAIADDISESKEWGLGWYKAKLDSCCERFAMYINPETKEKVYFPLRCNDRFCVRCARSRAWKARQLLDALLKERGLYEKAHSLKLITLTVENFPDDKLEWGLKSFHKWFKRLRQRKVWKENVKGYFEAFEIAKDLKGRWHLHLHLLAECKFIDVYQLSEEWSEVVSKEWNGFIVDIRVLRNPKKALREVTKYCYKPSSLSLEDRASLSSLLKKQRLYGFGGEWSKDFRGVSYRSLLYRNPFIEEIKRNWIFIGVFNRKDLNDDDWIWDEDVGVYRSVRVNTS